MRSWFPGIALFLCLLVAIAAPAQAPVPLDNPASGLRTWEVGDGTKPMVLLHGYASAPQEWLQFVATLKPGVPRRLIFPEGPDVRPDGRGRGWWPLELASHRDATGLPDLSRTRPPGLALASTRVRTLLDEVTTRLGSERKDLVLGGFSQGGIVAAEIAFRTDTPLKALVLLSPTVIDEPSWRDGIPQRRGLPVFLAHGRQDEILPFAASARLAETLRTAGLAVTWVPFDGGHDMPAPVIAALNEFLATVDR
jgi:phospholipase/carboxylesterase